MKASDLSNLTDEQKQRIEKLEQEFGLALALATTRNPDEEIDYLAMAEEFVSRLSTLSGHGKWDEPYHPYSAQQLQIAAVLLGGAKIAYPSFDTQMTPEVQPAINSAILHTFLDLVEQYVGKLDPHDPKKATLRMRLEGLEGPTGYSVEHTKK